MDFRSVYFFADRLGGPSYKSAELSPPLPRRGQPSEKSDDGSEASKFWHRRGEPRRLQAADGTHAARNAR